MAEDAAFADAWINTAAFTGRALGYRRARAAALLAMALPGSAP